MGTNNDSVYVDPDLITALYQNPANSVLLAEYAMRTGGVQLGLIPSSPTQDSVVNTTLVLGQGSGGGGGGGGSIGCPRVDQWVTAMGESEYDLVSRQASRISRGQFLYDQISGEWNEVASVDIIRDQVIWGVAAHDNNGKLISAYSSETHPIFRNADDRGIAVARTASGSTILINGKDVQKLLASARIPELGSVVRIELKSGHRYCYSDRPSGSRIDCHNAKAPLPPD